MSESISSIKGKALASPSQFLDENTSLQCLHLILVPVISSNQHFPSSPRSKISIIIGDVMTAPETAQMLFLLVPQDPLRVN